MRDGRGCFLVLDLFFSSTSENARTHERSRKRENKISIEFKTEEAKILPRGLPSSVQRPTRVSLVDQKFKKTATNFTTEVKTEKIQKKKSVGERNTLCRTDLVTAHLSNVLAFERVFLFETRTTRTRLFQRRRRWW